MLRRVAAVSRNHLEVFAKPPKLPNRLTTSVSNVARGLALSTIMSSAMSSSSNDKNAIPEALVSTCNDASIPQLNTLLSSYKNATEHDELVHKLAIRAIKYQQPAILEYCLNHGAQADDARGELASAAMGCESASMLQQLLSAGLDANGTLGHIGELLHVAVTTSNLDIIKCLVDNGADVNTSTLYNGYASLTSAAAEHASTDIFRYLVSKSLPLSGTLAMQYAAYAGREDMIELLLELGFDINNNPEPKDSEEADLMESSLGTALHYAADGRQFELTKMLLGKGAKPEIEDHEGRTVLQRLLDEDEVNVEEDDFAQTQIKDLLLQHGNSQGNNV